MLNRFKITDKNSNDKDIPWVDDFKKHFYGTAALFNRDGEKSLVVFNSNTITQPKVPYYAFKPSTKTNGETTWAMFRDVHYKDLVPELPFESGFYELIVGNLPSRIVALKATGEVQWKKALHKNTVTMSEVPNNPRHVRLAYESPRDCLTLDTFSTIYPACALVTHYNGGLIKDYPTTAAERFHLINNTRVAVLSRTVLWRKPFFYLLGQIWPCGMYTDEDRVRIINKGAVRFLQTVLEDNLPESKIELGRLTGNIDDYLSSFKKNTRRHPGLTSGLEASSTPSTTASFSSWLIDDTTVESTSNG